MSLNKYIRIISKFSCKCKICNEEIGEGEECDWIRGWGSKHTYCGDK